MASYICSRCRGCKNYTDIDTNIYNIPEYVYNECSGSASASFAWECDAYEEASMRTTKPVKEDTTIEDTVETIDQKIDKIKEYVEKINKLISDIEGNKNTKEVNKPEPPKDILAKYNNAIFNQLENTFIAWYIDNDTYNDNSIEWTDDPNFPKDNPLCYYPNKEYAEKALTLQKLNNALLAFKYCYDTDYEPDWEDDDERKYYVYLVCPDNETVEFNTDYTTHRDTNTVYFSESEIARKCAKWLKETFRKD